MLASATMTGKMSPQETTPTVLNTQVKKDIAEACKDAIVAKEGVSAQALKAVEHSPCAWQSAAYLLSAEFHQGDVANFLLKHLPCLKDIYEDYTNSGKDGKIRRDFGRKVKSASTYALNQSNLPVSTELTAILATPKKKRPTKNISVTPDPTRPPAVQPVPVAPHTDGKLKKKFAYRSANLSRRIDKNSSKLSSLESIAADTLQSTANLTEEFGRVYQGLERLGQGLGAVNQRVDHESESRRALEGRVDAELNAIRAHVGM